MVLASIDDRYMELCDKSFFLDPLYEGSVVKISMVESVANRWTQLCCKRCELLFERKRFGWSEIALQLPHHVNEFDTCERNASSGFRLEAEHGSYPSFHTAMILLDGVVLVFTGTDDDGPAPGLFQPCPAPA